MKNPPLLASLFQDWNYLFYPVNVVINYWLDNKQ